MYLAIRDRVMFVSTGTGLMALLTDGDIDDIIDEMKPCAGLSSPLFAVPVTSYCLVTCSVVY